MRLLFLTLIALAIAFSPAIADTNTDAHAAFAFAAINNEPPAPAVKMITLMVGCESGKCTPVSVPVGSLVTASGGIIVPLRTENGVTIYRDHEAFKGGSCQGGNCSGASTCAAGGSCSSCSTCTASASSTSQASSACSTGQCGSAATSGYRPINSRRGFAARVFSPTVSASGSCPTCPK